MSLFSVFVNNHWQPINDFIENECPFVMKSGFECLKMKSFKFAAIGVRRGKIINFQYIGLKLVSFGFQVNNIIAIVNISCNRKHCNKKVSKNLNKQ